MEGMRGGGVEGGDNGGDGRGQMAARLFITSLAHQ